MKSLPEANRELIRMIGKAAVEAHYEHLVDSRKNVRVSSGYEAHKTDSYVLAAESRI